MFKVQLHACDSCIYREDSPLDIASLERQIADRHMPGFFAGHRVCHHSDDVCCRGFWNKHKNHFAMGQVAQRLGMVQFVEVDLIGNHKGA